MNLSSKSLAKSPWILSAPKLSFVAYIYNYRFYILTLLCAINLLLGWPGTLLQDSAAQYLQAVSGTYNDHHPPIMSFLWRYLDMLHKGTGILFAFQILTLYAASAMLLHNLEIMVKNKIKLILSLIIIFFPVYPQISLYSGLIAKDVQYAFSFLAVGAVLAYYTISRKVIHALPLLLLLVLMTYGAAVKYQGKFCVVIFSIWLGALVFRNKNTTVKLIAGLLIYLLLLVSISLINHILVPQTSKSNAWQLVKLYDLAAISIATKQDLIPDFNKTSTFTAEKLYSRFKYPAVDSYIYSDDNILMATQDHVQLRALYKRWFSEVWAHPLIYLKHRAINMSYMLLSRPGFSSAKQLLHQIPPSSIGYKVANGFVSAIFYVFMSHLPVICIGVVYFFLALYSWSSIAAPALLAFSATALSMVGILFFMSMAGVPRYTYMSIVMIHAAHIFAYKCYRDLGKLR